MKTLVLAVALSVFTIANTQGYNTYSSGVANQCPRHEQWVGNKCECKKGYLRNNGVCSRCPEGSRYGCKSKTCICSDVDKYFNPTTFTCCANNHGNTNNNYNQGGNNNNYNQGGNNNNYNQGGNNNNYNQGGYQANNGAKVRVPDQYTIGTYTKLPPGGPYGPGKKCPKNSYWSAEYPCTCNWGTGWLNYDCVPNCQINEVFTPGGGCTCRSGYNKYDGVTCTYCPPRSYWENGGCYCEWGLVEQNGNCVDPYASNNNGYSNSNTYSNTNANTGYSTGASLPKGGKY